MKNHLVSLAAVAAVLLSGCSTPRLAERDRYFKPVIRRVQPLSPVAKVAGAPVAATPAPDPMVKILEGALAESRRELLELRMEMMGLRDSVRAFGAAARYQRDASLALADKVAVLEQQYPTTPRAASPVTPTPAPSALAKREAPLTAPQRPDVSLSSGAKTMNVEAEYQEGVALFNRRQYDDAHDWFARLLEGGIREDLADNCEYWLGECDFARRQWTQAVESFERVVALRGSNKRADALLMLGQSLQMLRQTSRARATYERLIREYPSSAAAQVGRSKLRSIPRSESGQDSGDPVMS
ncbi:MAG: tetratricopeptide repeat protein [Bacteroidetes bacterium]|jgi:tol-pal system protein YbgF|nr:tetratricopeptide repeat protein [Bacteroidota bacterium]